MISTMKGAEKNSDVTKTGKIITHPGIQNGIGNEDPGMTGKMKTMTTGAIEKGQFSYDDIT